MTPIDRPADLENKESSAWTSIKYNQHGGTTAVPSQRQGHEDPGRGQHPQSKHWLARKGRTRIQKLIAVQRFREMKFGIQSNQDMANQGVIEVSDRLLYNVDRGRSPAQYGAVDGRLV